MPERTSYAEGTPSWVDLATPNVENAERFYGELFGWESFAPGTIEETGGYKFFLSGGRKVAGVAPLMQEGRRQCGRPTSRPTTSTRSRRG